MLYRIFFFQMSRMNWWCSHPTQTTTDDVNMGALRDATATVIISWFSSIHHLMYSKFRNYCWSIFRYICEFNIYLILLQYNYVVKILKKVRIIKFCSYLVNKNKIVLASRALQIFTTQSRESTQNNHDCQIPSLYR